MTERRLNVSPSPPAPMTAAPCAGALWPASSISSRPAAGGDAEVASIIAEAGIDILVDLGGHTIGARPGVLARRPAAIQAGWQGLSGHAGRRFHGLSARRRHRHPAGTGTALCREGAAPAALLLPFDPTRAMAEKLTRAEVGLPETGLVFCAFNSCWKIVPEVLAVWLELLRETPGSILWLRADNASSAQGLKTRHPRKASHRNGWSLPRAEEEVHLGRHRLADIFLDTFPIAAIPPPSMPCGPDCRWWRWRDKVSPAWSRPARWARWACPNWRSHRSTNTRR